MVLGLGIGAAGCVPPRVPEAPSQAIAQALRAQLVGDAGAWVGPALDWAPLRAFYAARDFAPAWCDANGPLPRAAQLVAALDAAPAQGLRPEDYPVAAIRAQWSRRQPAELARLDVLLTDAFLRYSRDLSVGREDPQAVDPGWHIPRPAFDPVAVLESALRDHGLDATLRELPPPGPGYRQLQDALARYRRVAQRGGWAALPPGPDLEPGMDDEQVALLRDRLQAEGDLKGGGFIRGSRYDEALQVAVERFQARHGLEADGVVGPQTRAALDVPVQARIAQIERSMERWRWLPREPGARYVLIDLRGFQLQLVDHGAPVLAMRVIAGTPDQPTPEFSARLESIVVNPYWTVPARIAREDLLPRERRDPRFFATRGIRVYRVHDGKMRELDPAKIRWARVSAEPFPYVLRQDPGPMNSLGRLKFVLPNPYDVYLHDTPERALFNAKLRTFSAGCIRLEHAVELAAQLLAGTGWNEERIREAIASGRTEVVGLPVPVPVYVVDWPAWAADGEVGFRPDVYHRDPGPGAAAPPLPAGG